MIKAVLPTKTNEAAMKYVISGGIGTAITLFGMSYLYGITGSTNIVDMQKVLTKPGNNNKTRETSH